MRERDGFGGTLLVKDIATVSAMVFPICKCEGCPAPHANLAVGPLRRSAAVYHTARDLDLGRKLKTFFLQTLVDFVDVGEIVARLSGTCPGLDEVEDLLLDFFANSSNSVSFEQGDEVVHKLS